MPTILIVAGPNGAGKTTFANAWFRDQSPGWAFVNADEIARDTALANFSGAERDIRAGRLMLDRIRMLAKQGRDFAFETTLASRLYARRISSWRAQGYRIELTYIRLPDVEASLARVARRVASGGHDIAEIDIRRRFSRSLWNLDHVYKPAVDLWTIWDSVDGGVILSERSAP